MTLTLPPPPAPSTVLPLFNRGEAAKVLSAATAGEVHVVVAAPGQGKSDFTRVEIAKLIHASTLTRVLWAVHSIEGEQSLGQEAQEDFDLMGVINMIVRGREHLTHADYLRQFDWPAHPSVKIISHARLPMAFGGGSEPSARLADAELLVIDEDPSSGLLLASITEDEDPAARRPADPDLRLSTLAATGDPVCVALERLTAGGKLLTASAHRHTGYIYGRALYGVPLWPHLAEMHPVDTISLAQALRKNRVNDADAQLVAQGIADDAERAHNGKPVRLSFGVHAPGKVGPALLRYNLRRKLEFKLPIVVLDGYADAAYYATLFDEQVVMHTYHPGRALDVECNKALFIDLLKDGKPEGRQRRIQVAEELAGQSPGRKQVTILKKVLQDAGSEWRRLVTRACSEVRVPEPARMHWYAGRGLNRYKGHDVYALTPTRLSTLYQHYTLAALYPEDSSGASERERLHNHAQSAELLQMLNRGRQPNFAPSDPDRPRVVLALDEETARTMLGPLVHRAVLRPYVPLLNLASGSTNPRWRDMTEALGRELLNSGMFPDGLPAPLMEGLPQHGSAEKRGVKACRAADSLGVYAASCPVGSHIHSAFHARATWQYRDVPKGGGANSGELLTEAMARLGLEVCPGKGKTYLRPGASGKRVLADFEMFLRIY